MYEDRNWHTDKIVQATVENLKKHGFTVLYVQTKEEAVKAIMDMIPRNAKVGIGGSVTIREIGLDKALNERGNVLADHWKPGLSRDQAKKARLEQLSSDVFLSSTNAVTTDGKLLNIDGTGNRVAAMIYGPPKVIIVAGINKVVKDLDEAMSRVRNIATSMNAKRLKVNSLCAQTGLCAEDECQLPERLCHIITILERRPNETDTTIVLVGEKLGY
jgi:L-lactate utilization protein LutB